MSDSFTEFLKEINIAQLIGIACAGWFLNNHFDKIELKRDVDRLAKKVEDLERRV